MPSSRSNMPSGFGILATLTQCAYLLLQGHIHGQRAGGGRRTGAGGLAGDDRAGRPEGGRGARRRRRQGAAAAAGLGRRRQATSSSGGRTRSTTAAVVGSSVRRCQGRAGVVRCAGQCAEEPAASKELMARMNAPTIAPWKTKFQL